MAEWWKAGLSQANITKRLNKDKRTNIEGNPWSRSDLGLLIRRYLTPAEYAEAKRANEDAARLHADAVLLRVLELQAKGFTLGQIKDSLNKEGRETSLGRDFNEARVARLLALSHGGAALGGKPLILEDGKPALVLSLDGRYREKDLGIGKHAASRRKVLKALLAAGTDGLSDAFLRHNGTTGGHEYSNA